jgi:hypothetical protein
MNSAGALISHTITQKRAPYGFPSPTISTDFSALSSLEIQPRQRPISRAITTVTAARTFYAHWDKSV